MPWEIRQGTSQCSGYGVFKEGTSELEGCHTTREAAQRQMAALYASEPGATEKEVITSDKTPNKYPDYIGPKKKKVKKMMEPGSFTEGDFAMGTVDDEVHVGQIVHIMTDGMLGVEGSKKTIMASPDNPAILIRIFEQHEDGYWKETDYFVGFDAMSGSKIDALPMKGEYFRMGGVEKSIDLEFEKYRGELYSMLTEEEKAYHDALLSIADQYGPFDQGTSSIWVGYETGSENEDAAIGVKCANCSFFNPENNGCAILSYPVEAEGKCRLAAIPDGLVNPEMNEPSMNRNEMQEFVDDMMERIGKAENVRVGQMVSWNSSGGRAMGRVIRIIRNGRYNVPNSDFTITGTPDDPAVAIRLYRDGEPTDTMVGHKMSTLRRVGKSMDIDLNDAMEILKSIEKKYKDKEKYMDNDEDDWEKRDYSTEQRRRMAESGEAMSDGSFPIANRTDLGNAIQSVGRASNYDAARRHIIGRARALDAVDMLPEDWNVSKSVESDSAQQAEVPSDLSSIFTNMPRHAKRVNTTGNAPVNFTFLQGDK